MGQVFFCSTVVKIISIKQEYIRLSKVILATIVEGDQKAPFLIANTPRYRGGRNSFPWIAPLYPLYLPYIAEC